MVKESSVIAKCKSVKCTQLPDGEAVLLNLENKYFYTLNCDAFSVWSQLNGKDNIGKIACRIAAKHSLDNAGALEIVLEQVKELLNEKLAEAVR